MESISWFIAHGEKALLQPSLFLAVPATVPGTQQESGLASYNAWILKIILLPYNHSVH